MPLTRKQLSQLYRPQHVKALSTGNSVPFATGVVPAPVTVAGPSIDLSVPLRGFRFIFSGRDVIGTAAMTSINPLMYANLIKEIIISGRNSRAGGANQVLFDMDLPSWLLYTAQFNPNAPWSFKVAGVTVNFIGEPLANSNFGNVATGTYDFRIKWDVHMYPEGANEAFRLGYLLRNQEWGDSLQIKFNFGQYTNNATDFLGVEAATTTHTFTSYGAGTGNPVLDVYGLPQIAGLDLDPEFVPGFYSRVAIPLSTVLQSAGGIQTKLATLQKQRTLRVALISGVSTVNPALASVNDTNVTTLGVIVGGNRVVRENDDVQAHKAEITDNYASQQIQGVTCAMDTMQGGNPDSAYEGDNVGDGATFELRGTVAGLANAYGQVIQEMELYRPQGRLYLAD